MRRIEELSLNAWPALQTLLLDGWILRFADGYTKRANSVNPLYPTSRDHDELIDLCERTYRAQGLPTIFKLTSDEAPAGLDDRLTVRGYRLLDPTHVMLRPLDDIIAAQEPPNLAVTATLTPRWLADYARMNGVAAANVVTLERMLKVMVPARRLVTLYEDEQPIGCALVVIQGSHAGIFDVVIESSMRGRGLGRQLMHGVLDIAQAAGAKTAYLQVVKANTLAVSLYRSLGFAEAYHYWYRTQ